jgi:hypothetical protein
MVCYAILQSFFAVLVVAIGVGFIGLDGRGFVGERERWLNMRIASGSGLICI